MLLNLKKVVLNMKRTFFLLAIVLCLSFLIVVPACADDDNWSEKPVITSIYEIGSGKLFIEWEGQTNLYRVYLDDKPVKDVNIDNATLDVKPGSHKIKIQPIKYIPKDDADTQISLNIANLVDGSIDLSALGIEAKDLQFGTYSETFKLDYNSNGVIGATPKVIDAAIDDDSRVLLEIQDNFDADIYRVFIKSGKDKTSADFDVEDVEASEYIQKGPSSVTLILDQAFLEKFGCMRPLLDNKYEFSVMLRERPRDYVKNEKVVDTLLDSKESKPYEYMPMAKWKSGLNIEVSTQAGQGTVLLKWDHDDYGKGVEYQILEYDKLLVVKTSEKEIGRTKEKEFEINDLVNGKYTFAVVPVYDKEKGEAVTVDVEVTADWVQAPELNCNISGEKDVKLTWMSPDKVDSYHITVSAGSGNLLRFINLDYKKIAEFDVPATPGSMEFTYTYPDVVDPETGVKLKFEIYGVHHVAGKEDQKSSTSNQSIVLK